MTQVDNPMRPMLGRLESVRDLADEIKLLRIDTDGAAFDYQPGQVAFLSAFGVGEAPFGIASTSGRSSALEFAIARVGTVTAALHRMEPGEVVGMRGPLGNGFPLESWRGKDIVVLGGGIGGAPLRPVIQTILDHRSDYGRLSILWAARTPSLLIFTDEFDGWRNASQAELHLTVDEGDSSWTENVGLITELLEKVAQAAEGAAAIICGPPVMIRFTILALQKLGFADEQITMTLEAKMKCGIGKCGRCNFGEQFVCLHGPVFTYPQVSNFLESFV